MRYVANCFAWWNVGHNGSLPAANGTIFGRVRWDGTVR